LACSAALAVLLLILFLFLLVGLLFLRVVFFLFSAARAVFAAASTAVSALWSVGSNAGSCKQGCYADACKNFLDVFLVHCPPPYQDFSAKGGSYLQNLSLQL
jgi:hypothetical protein